MRCAATDVGLAALPATALPLAKNPLRSLSSPLFFYLLL